VIIVVLLLLIIILLSVYLCYFKQQVNISLGALDKLKDLDASKFDPRSFFAKKGDEKSLFTKDGGVSMENPNYDADC